MTTPLSVRNTNLPRNQFEQLRTIPAWAWALPLLPLLLWQIVALVSTPIELFLQINEKARELPVNFWVFFNLFGNGWIDFALVSPLLLLAPKNLVASVCAGAIAGLSGRILKLTFELPRPASVLDPTSFHILGNPLTSLAMPSGHTLTAFALITAFYFSTTAPKRKPLLCLFVISIMAGIARIAVGAHWPADVMAGAAVGILGGLLGVHFCRNIPQQLYMPQSWLMRVLAAGSALCVYVLVTSQIDFPQAKPFQWVAAAIGTLSLLAFAVQTVRRPRHA
jgi:membrane-associated phospholipid phosphatase